MRRRTSQYDMQRSLEHLPMDLLRTVEASLTLTRGDGPTTGENRDCERAMRAARRAVKKKQSGDAAPTLRQRRMEASW